MFIRKDFENKESRIESESVAESQKILREEIEELRPKIISTPISSFEPFYTGEDWGIIEASFGGVTHINEIKHNFEKIKEYAFSHESEFDKRDDLNATFLMVLKRMRVNDIFLQKITYEIEDDEDFDAIVENLSNRRNYQALYKSILADKDKRRIITYTSTNGLWIVNGLFQFKRIQKDSGISIRSSYSPNIQKEDKIVPMKDISKLNFSIYEEIKELLEKEIIISLCVKVENAERIWTEVTSRYGLEHFVNLSEDKIAEERLKREVIKQMKIEDSPYNKKPNANLQEMNQTLENNKSEMHTIHDEKIADVISMVDYKVDEKQNESMDSFFNRLVEQEEAKAQKAILKMKQRVSESKKQFPDAKELFFSYLKIGKTDEEAILEIETKGYNEVTIKLVKESLKSEALKSHEKSGVILALQGELRKTQDRLQDAIREIEKLEVENIDQNKRVNRVSSELEASRLRSKEYENKLYEAHVKMEKLESMVEPLVQKAESMQSMIESQKADILDINLEKDELQKENYNLHKELDEIFVQKDILVTKLNENLEESKAQNEKIELLLADKTSLTAEKTRLNTIIQDKEIENSTIMQELNKKLKELQELKMENNSLKIELESK
jgi:hypothetical protein